VDGVEALRQIKEDPSLRKLPSSCSPPRMTRARSSAATSSVATAYIVKRWDYDKFAEAIKQLGMFVSLVQVPEINGKP